jgi:hypothetical protein
MGKFGTFNKMSKIYSPQRKTSIFEGRVYKIYFKTVKEALDYFFTPEALASYKYCHRFEQKLIDNYSLHWTIDFGVPENPNEKPWADCWKDTKQILTDRGSWFNHPTKITHDAPHLF